jgi:hypothetical protein
MSRVVALALAALALGAGPAVAADITSVAGDGRAGFSGDGGPATAAELFEPRGVAALSTGGFLFADRNNRRIRFVAPDGTITTVAGNGNPDSSGDGGPATAAGLDGPTDVSLTGDGGYLICEERGRLVRRVAPDGTIRTVAGNGQGGSAGDGGPAVNAQINNPVSVASTGDGGFLVTDTADDRIRRVGSDGKISTVAGGGTAGPGDGGAATAAQLSAPVSVAPTADGGFLITERDTPRVRKVASDGTIATVAGTGTPGFSGDGGPATAAQFTKPGDAIPTADGGFLVADRDNGRIRQVAPNGTITTVAGGGTGSLDQTRPATDADLANPAGLALLANGAFLITDIGAQRVLHVGESPAPPPPADGAAPLLSGLRVTPAKLKYGRGAKVTFKLSEAAAVKFRLERAKEGRRSGSRCVPKTRGNRKKRKCKYFKLLGGEFGTQGAAGANTYSYNGRLKGVKLAPAEYRLVATATDGAGNTGKASKAAFKVKR